MASFMKEFEHLKVNLQQIKNATNSFGNEIIGKGGFGAVYKGEVAHSKGRNIVAIKRLNRQFGQGDPEFLKEIMMLSRYKHQNLISLLGYCDEDGEKILVYEYASNGSLDQHLSDPGLSWTQRLKICIGAAKGLSYLHDPNRTHQRVLHCDIKSSNILLDENFNAKVADFGLAKLCPANHQYSVLFTNARGTPGYCDPLYMMSYALTKESDIYSFGVVLFEVLCGRLCTQVNRGELKVFVPMWKKSYTEKKLQEIIFQDLMQQMDPTSLEIFSDIAFHCLQNSREKRPTMSNVLKKLKLALEFQELHYNNAQFSEDLSENVGLPSSDLDIGSLQITRNEDLEEIRVGKRGSVGRTIDVTRYKGYEDLRPDLARMFGIEGQLENAQRMEWIFVYVDHENDILLLGDDPWYEFVSCVQSIKILPYSEVQKMGLNGDLGNVPVPNQASSSTDSGNSWRNQYDDYSAQYFDR